MKSVSQSDATILKSDLHSTLDKSIPNPQSTPTVVNPNPHVDSTTVNPKSQAMSLAIKSNSQLSISIPKSK